MTDVQSFGLLEREVESAAIAGAMKAAAQGHGGLLLVEGPAGIGKTRLLAQARSAAAESGQTVARARASELERDFAFGAVRQLFEPLLARTDPTGQEALWEGPATQAREIFTHTTNPETGPTGNFALLHGLYWLTANACQHHPLLLLVDDLQWCDTPSLRYLAYLLPRLEDLPILVVAARRTGETATDQRLLDQITTNPAVQVLQPQPLSARAALQLLRQTLPDAVDEQFAAACHQVAGGNPLLLRELTRTLTAEHLPATASNAARVADLVPQAVDQLVALRMARLPPTCQTLARAVAVLGDRTDLATAATLAGQDLPVALEGLAALEQLEILRLSRDGHILSFVHPLVRSAVYHAQDAAERTAAHQRAAQLLAETGSDPEKTAAHLLHIPPAGAGNTVTALGAAATQAQGRGSPESAFTYLRRALEEPLTETQRAAALLETGRAASVFDMAAAAEYLGNALGLLLDPGQRAETARLYGNALMFLGHMGEAFAVWNRAAGQLPGDSDSRRHLHARMVVAPALEPGCEDLLVQEPFLRHLPPSDGPGSLELNASVALRDAFSGDPDAITRVRRIVEHSQHLEFETAGAAWWVLAIGADEAVDTLTAALADIHRRGDTRALAVAAIFRAGAWLGRGQLAEAETDARTAQQATDMSGLDLGRPFAAAYLAEALMEQGNLPGAQAALGWSAIPDPVPPSGPMYIIMDARARLLRLQGDHAQALQAALDCGKRYTAHGGQNPAIIPWRTEAALSLHALGRTDQARTLAAEELPLARRWGTPRTLGRTLRINGLVAGGGDQLELLREATSVLEGSPARLEYAKALADLGATLRRTGHRTDARPHLRQALDLATQCGATPLADRVHTELAAAGGRPRRTELTGPDSLTPSEHRIAHLAATGATNRQIAQQLYVTPKTVEVHLSAVYRKLNITTRTQLATALATP